MEILIGLAVGIVALTMALVIRDQKRQAQGVAQAATVILFAGLANLGAWLALAAMRDEEVYAEDRVGKLVREPGGANGSMPDMS